jgi:hypothetical protein
MPRPKHDDNQSVDGSINQYRYAKESRFSSANNPADTLTEMSERNDA